MVKSLSKLGLLLASLFVALSMYSTYQFLCGEFEAFYVMAFVTFPFSFLIGIATHQLAAYFDISPGISNWISVFFTVLVGSVEFYLIGWLLSFFFGSPIRRR